MAQSAQKSSIGFPFGTNILSFSTYLAGTSSDFTIGNPALTVTDFTFNNQSIGISGTDATIDGPYFNVDVTAAGIITLNYTNPQGLIDLIDASTTPFSIPLTYTVSDGTSTVTDTVNIDPSDINFTPPDAVTVAFGQTTVLSGMSIVVSPPTGNASFNPSLTVTVLDDYGTLGFGPNPLQGTVSSVAADPSMVGNGAAGGVTITGTESQINADLAQMTYTGVVGRGPPATRASDREVVAKRGDARMTIRRW